MLTPKQIEDVKDGLTDDQKLEIDEMLKYPATYAGTIEAYKALAQERIANRALSQLLENAHGLLIKADFVAIHPDRTMPGHWKHQMLVDWERQKTALLEAPDEQ